MAYLISNLLPQRGSHPVSKSEIHLPGSLYLYDSCYLHVYFTLPPLLFVDTHELTQRSKSYSFNHWGSRDLERPVHAVPDGPTELLVNVRMPADAEEEEEMAVTIVEVPMHLRYGTPKDSEGQTKPYDHLQVDWPQAFLRCPSTSQLEHIYSPPELPDRVLDVLSQPNTILLSIPPHPDFPSRSQNTLIIPLGNTQDLLIVETFTALTIFLCFIWLFRVSWRIATRLNTRSQRPKTS